MNCAQYISWEGGVRLSANIEFEDQRGLAYIWAMKECHTPNGTAAAAVLRIELEGQALFHVVCSHDQRVAEYIRYCMGLTSASLVLGLVHLVHEENPRLRIQLDRRVYCVTLEGLGPANLVQTPPSGALPCHTFAVDQIASGGALVINKNLYRIQPVNSLYGELPLGFSPCGFRVADQNAASKAA